MIRVNLGCGSVFHPDWINLDSIPVGNPVRRWDIRKLLPFASGKVDACYASHVLEHLTRLNANELLRECHRILVPGGIIRLVVPDLENIALNYLKSLSNVAEGAAPVWQHEWMIIELIDQMVRREAGGEMHRTLVEADEGRRQFLVGRIGLEAAAVFASMKSDMPKRLSLALIAHYARRAREEMAGTLVSLVLGAEGRVALKEGLFRRSGQVHHWMYDRLSLGRLLEEAGFVSVKMCLADESRIDGFNSFNLDTLNGRVRKPDSLFVEALRP